MEKIEPAAIALIFDEQSEYGANSIKLGPEIKEKMWLSHYQDFVPKGKDMFGNDVDWDKEIKNDGFAGRIKVGQVFEA